MKVETIKIKTDSQKGFKIINKDDFDPKRDKEWKPKTTRSRTKKEK